MTENIAPIRPDYDKPNYDVSKIAPYVLEDPLTFLDGTKVTSPKQWQKRRKEILEIFAREMYGVEPPAPEALVTEITEECVGALAGFAIRRQYSMWFKKDKTGPCIHWIMYCPRYAKHPTPVILFLNYRGNYELTLDKEVPIPNCWVRNGNYTENNLPTENTRGQKANPASDTVFPIGMILARGYAVLTACYGEVSPDPDIHEPNPLHAKEEWAYQGVFELWGKRDETRDDNVTSLGAWAWALSRGLDLAERIPELDAKRAVVTGCSRLGKAAFIAMARDERFAVAVPNQCGGGGVTLAKRDYGECIGTEMHQFPHWYCHAYGKYAKNPAKLLTFDQHLLLAAIAPRRILIEGFDTSRWFDTEGEYLACKAASPAWELFGLPGLPGDHYPQNYETTAIGPYLGYVRRSELHGISAYDWQWMLDFADQSLK